MPKSKDRSFIPFDLKNRRFLPRWRSTSAHTKAVSQARAYCGRKDKPKPKMQGRSKLERLVLKYGFIVCVFTSNILQLPGQHWSCSSEDFRHFNGEEPKVAERPGN